MERVQSRNAIVVMVLFPQECLICANGTENCQTGPFFTATLDCDRMEQKRADDAVRRWEAGRLQGSARYLLYVESLGIL